MLSWLLAGALVWLGVCLFFVALARSAAIADARAEEGRRELEREMRFHRSRERVAERRR